MSPRPSDAAPGSAGPRPVMPIGDAIAAAIGEFVRLILQHAGLARAELADSSANLGLAALFAVAAVAVGFVAAILLLAAAALALAIVLPVWLAFLLVGAAALAMAGFLLVLARRRARRCSLVPRRALASLRGHLADLAGPRP